MMDTLGSLVISLAQVLQLLISIYTYIIAGSVIISWVGADPQNPIVRFLRQATEPVFYRVRKLMPKSLFRTGLDFTPMIVLVLLILIENVVVKNLIYGLAQKLLAR